MGVVVAGRPSSHRTPFEHLDDQRKLAVLEILAAAVDRRALTQNDVLHLRRLLSCTGQVLVTIDGGHIVRIQTVER